MCYTIPLAGAVTISLLWKKRKSLKLWWLNLMLYGASLFRVVDHLWNGELFLVSENWVKDLCLGAVITLAIFVSWGTIIALTKISPPLARYVRPEKVGKGKAF